MIESASAVFERRSIPGILHGKMLAISIGSVLTDSLLAIGLDIPKNSEETCIIGTTHFGPESHTAPTNNVSCNIIPGNESK